MRRLLILVVSAIFCSATLLAQGESSQVVLKPVVSDSIALSAELREILLNKMTLMCTQNGVEAGESRYVIAPLVELTEVEMTASIPPKCIVELTMTITIVDEECGQQVSQTDYKIKSIESNKDKAVYKAISRMNVKTSKIRKFMLVSKEKIESLKQ